MSMQTDLNSEEDTEVRGEAHPRANSLYIKKSVYAGKTIYATTDKLVLKVVNGETLTDKFDLRILIDGENKVKKLTLSDQDHDDMIALFGANYDDWRNKRIKIVFSDIKSWDGGNGLTKTGATSKISRV